MCLDDPWQEGEDEAEGGHPSYAAPRQVAPAASSRCHSSLSAAAASAAPGQPPAATAPSHAGVGGGSGVQGMLDLAAELEDLLQDDGEEEQEAGSTAVGDSCQQQEASADRPPHPHHPGKPATLAHLTHATSRSAVAAAARAEVAAAAAEQPPRLLAHEVAGGRVLPVTAADGRRVYCSLAPGRDSFLSRKGRSQGASGRLGGGLLGRPITELLAAVEAARTQVRGGRGHAAGRVKCFINSRSVDC
jgi:hypothetical protein